MKGLPWREIFVGLAIAIGTTAAGAAIDVRDRVAAVELREDGREDTQRVRDTDIMRRLDRIEGKLDSLRGNP